MPSTSTPSKSEVMRAGVIIREWLTSDPRRRYHQAELDAFLVIQDWRARHQLPLTKAAMGTRSMVATCGYPVEVSQRLKRLSTIIDKLIRQPKMSLARMQDIGGCRAVLPDIDAVYAVQRRATKNGRVHRSKDYIAEPAASGYRGVHLIVGYDDRLIEVQLRTQMQHEWAITVERMSGRLDTDLKSGYGPPQVLELLAAISQAMALEERGLPVDRNTTAELDRLRLLAAPWLKGGSA